MWVMHVWIPKPIDGRTEAAVQSTLFHHYPNKPYSGLLYGVKGIEYEEYRAAKIYSRQGATRSLENTI